MAKYTEIIDIEDILNEYSEDISEGITQAAIKIAEQGKNELKNTAPKNTGKYRKGFRVDKKVGKGFVCMAKAMIALHVKAKAMNCIYRNGKAKALTALY